MRCLAAGYEERRRRRWRCCGGVQVSVAVHVYADGVRDGCGRSRKLWSVARSIEVPEPAQDETVGIPATRTQRQRVLDHRQRTGRRTDPAQRLQIHGASPQLQRGHRVQRRRGYRCWPTNDPGKTRDIL